MDHTDPGKDERVGHQDKVTFIPNQKAKRRTWVDHQARTWKTARKTWTQMGKPFMYEVIAGNMWRAVGWNCDEGPNAVIDTKKKSVDGEARNGGIPCKQKC